MPMVIALLAVATLATPAVAADRDGIIKVIINYRATSRLETTRAIRNEGGQVGRRFELINAVSAQVPRVALKSLRANPAIKSVEIDAKIEALDHGPATGNAELESAWGVEHIGAGDVHASGNTGQGVRVGVIDTGVDYSHPDLDSVYVGGWDFFNNDSDPMDDHGHGTHVAGILAAERNDPPAGVVGVAPDVDLYAYKVLGANGQGDYSGLIAALERAALIDDVDVVNMSLGGKVATDALAAAVAAAYAEGVVLVAASGNVDPTNFLELLYGCPVAYPARYPEVMSTTFTGQNNELTGYSCTGPEVDFGSPGDLINSTVPSGGCPLCAPSGYRADMSGTSMASPHLAGTVALVLSHGITNSGDPDTAADDVRAHLCANTSLGFGVLSTPIPPTDPRYAQYFGCGMTDANKALLANPPPTDEEPPANEPPVANNDAGTTTQDTARTIDVLANDTDPEGDDLAVTGVSAPGHGSAAILSNSVVYTPAAGFVGSDSFSYTVSDGQGGSDTGMVNITVTLPSGPTLHVGDLDPTSTLQANSWTARVTIQVHNVTHGKGTGAVVTGVFSTGAVRSCTSSSGAGKCTVSLTGRSLSRASLTFTVTSITKSGRTYTPSLNHDPDGDSDGTTITVPRP